MPISNRCYHVPDSEGQICTCIDTLMWTRFGLQLACERVVELEEGRTERQGLLDRLTGLARLRQAYKLACKRIVELERKAQHGDIFLMKEEL